GEISGYCAMVNWNKAIPPTSTMTMERTAAKIGRRMKKWEKFMRRETAMSIGGSVLCFSKRFCVHDEARPHAHQPFNDDQVARLQTGTHDPQAVNHRAGLHRAEFDLLFGIDDIDKLLGLI